LAESKDFSAPQRRMRVFAGPNGSGKSTVIEQVRKVKSSGKFIDFGFYVNADDIALNLRRGGFSFNPFKTQVTDKEFQEVV
jgi:predicted ATP-binding protein involved in virulence